MLVLGAWQLFYLSNFHGDTADHLVKGPGAGLSDLWNQMQHAQLWQAILTTVQTAVVGYLLALLIGSGRRRGGLADLAAARGHGIDHQRPADHAVDRLVPVRTSQDNQDLTGAISIMIVILVIGVVVDAIFSKTDLAVRRRRGLLTDAQSI